MKIEDLRIGQIVTVNVEGKVQEIHAEGMVILEVGNSTIRVYANIIKKKEAQDVSSITN